MRIDASNEIVVERARAEVFAFLADAENDDVETTEYEPDRLVGFRATAGPVRPQGRYELTPDGTGTRVRFSFEAELGGLKLVMAPAVRRAMGGEVGHLDNLKRVLEAAGPRPSPIAREQPC